MASYIVNEPFYNLPWSVWPNSSQIVFVITMFTYFDVSVLDLSCALMIVFDGIMWFAPVNDSLEI